MSFQAAHQSVAIISSVSFTPILWRSISAGPASAILRDQESGDISVVSNHIWFLINMLEDNYSDHDETMSELAEQAVRNNQHTRKLGNARVHCNGVLIFCFCFIVPLCPRVVVSAVRMMPPCLSITVASKRPYYEQWRSRWRKWRKLQVGQQRENIGRERNKALK